MLFVGLIFDILIIIFVVVAILLIYSLLLISVETKTFEVGVMRMIGLTKCGFVSMILTQAGLFVLPSFILGFGLSIPLIYFLYAGLFESSLGYMPSIMPSPGAILRSIFIGLFIPLVSSIIPIKRALQTNLNDALNVNRSKNKGTLIEIVDKRVTNMAPYLLFGTVAVLFGIAIYYGLPVAML